MTQRRLSKIEKRIYALRSWGEGVKTVAKESGFSEAAVRTWRRDYTPAGNVDWKGSSPRQPVFTPQPAGYADLPVTTPQIGRPLPEDESIPIDAAFFTEAVQNELFGSGDEPVFSDENVDAFLSLSRAFGLDIEVMEGAWNAYGVFSALHATAENMFQEDLPADRTDVAVYVLEMLNPKDRDSDTSIAYYELVLQVDLVSAALGDAIAPEYEGRIRLKRHVAQQVVRSIIGRVSERKSGQ